MRLAKEQHALYGQYIKIKKQAQEAEQALMESLKQSQASKNEEKTNQVQPGASQAQQESWQASQIAQQTQETQSAQQQIAQEVQVAQQTQVAAQQETQPNRIVEQPQVMQQAQVAQAQPIYAAQQATVATQAQEFSAGTYIMPNTQPAITQQPYQQPIMAQQMQQQAMVQQMPQQINVEPVATSGSQMTCPNCGSPNVQVQVVEQGQQTNKKGVGFGGHMNNMARGAVAISTLGMSNLVWKKSEGTNKTKTINATMGVCQSCGNTWEIKKGKFGRAPGSIFR